MKVCQVCGKPIESPRATKYCSPQCRAHVKYERDRAWLTAHPGKAAEYGRQWYAKNTEICKQVSREAYRKKALARIELEKSGA
jgi:hypothetical protein